MSERLRAFIAADARFQRAAHLTSRRFLLPHPTFRRYYLGERVCLQWFGARLVPRDPPEDMLAGGDMIVTPQHYEGSPSEGYVVEEDYEIFCLSHLMPPIGSRFVGVPREPRFSHSLAPSTDGSRAQTAGGRARRSPMGSSRAGSSRADPTATGFPGAMPSAADPFAAGTSGGSPAWAVPPSALGLEGDPALRDYALPSQIRYFSHGATHYRPITRHTPIPGHLPSGPIQVIFHKKDL